MKRMIWFVHSIWIIIIGIYNKNRNNMKIKLTENSIKEIIAESVKKILKENSIDNDTYFGGGLPDKYFDDDMPDNGKITELDIKELNEIADKLADIGNNRDCDTELLFQAIKCVEKFISNFENTIKK